MSIGSETFGGYSSPDGVYHRGIENVDVYDLTIDADSRPVGYEAMASDFNGIRVKSDESRGGLVNNITYTDICMRDMTNAILVSTAYNPLFAGTLYPEFKTLTFRNIHHVTCKGLQRPVVTLEGFNATMPLGPVTLDNVIIDNMGKMDSAAEFADILNAHTLAAGNASPAAQRADLLTAVMHEMGHVLGYGDTSADDLMDSMLPLGTRRLPGNLV